MKKFIRTRGAPPAPQPPAPAPRPSHATHPPHPASSEGHKNKTNGHANGAAPAPAQPDDLRSTLSSSRYWSESSEGGGVGGVRGAAGEAWCDPEFPADWRALGDSKRRARDVQWLRPCEMSARPVFWGGPRSDDEEDEGEEGEAEEEDLAVWSGGEACLVPALCGAAAALAHTPRLLARALCLPGPRQHLRAPRSTHRLRFQFWVWGVWRGVEVDDRLPARGGRPLTPPPPRKPHDYTLPLLEKAYAKLYGSYERARAAPLPHALQELSGGAVQALPLPPSPSSASSPSSPSSPSTHVLHSALPRATLVFATLKDVGRRESGRQSSLPYLVTGLARAGGAGLVRARGAGGRGALRGAWGAGGAAWRALPPHDRDVLARRLTRPGDFWMSTEELCSWFSVLVLVHVGPDGWLLERALRARRPWRCVLARRRLVPGHNAGGAPARHPRTADANPQFHLQVPDTVDKCHVLVSVMGQYWLGGGGGGGGGGEELGFTLYAVGRGAARLAPLPLGGRAPLDAGRCGHCGRAREVAALLALPPGDYRVVLHAARAHRPAHLLLRLLTDAPAAVWEVNEDNVLLAAAAAAAPPPAPPAPVTQEERRLLRRLLGPRDFDDLYLEAEEVSRALVAAGAWRGCRAPPAPLLRALLALGADGLGGGALRARALPALLGALAWWRAAWAAVGGGRGWVPALQLRALLGAAGVRASNKVLEALVRRHAARPGGARARAPRLSLAAALTALATLHLAHQRHRALESRLKTNPLSLEEMILMTIYS